jgi:hypothetical protein
MPSRINKSAIIKQPFEHILIDGFVNPRWVKATEDEFLATVEMHQCNEGLPVTERIYTTKTPHSAQRKLFHLHNDLIKAVNETWNLNTVKLIMTENVLQSSDYIGPHNDLWYPEIPVRGILYLNKEKKYGTHLYTMFEDYHNAIAPVEVGGEPGQLLLIRVSRDSYHSVGMFSDLGDRITLNFMFSNIDDVPKNY